MEPNDFEEIMVFAIEKEEMSCHFYSQAGMIVQNESPRKLCSRLADEEKKHIQTLEAFKKNHKPHILHKTLEASVWIDMKTKTEIQSDMSGLDILNVAMRHEKKSMDFYLKMSENSIDIRCMNLFLLLAKEEKTHLDQLNHTISSFQFKKEVNRNDL